METISEFYSGKNVFITGATGFMGKVLLEKLLRSCPNIGNIYVLVRPRKGQDPNKRMKDIIDLPLFDVLKSQNPENLKKIIPIFGDCGEINLGLSKSDRQELEEKVSVVFHSAASVKFDDPLKYAVLMNTRSTREVMMIVRNMKNLRVMVHVSTCYCNCDREIVEEVVYPPHADWREIINMVETLDEHTINILTPKILNSLPNTYVFTKSLAEHVVTDLGKNLPVVILRPSVVISTLNDPVPGWVDNLNGPVGLLMGGGKGIVRVCYGNPHAAIDYMPVDVAIKFLLTAAWEKALSGKFLEPSVYQVSSGNVKRISLEQLLKLGELLSEETPLNNILWIPKGCVLKNYTWYFWNMLLFHLIPALVFDIFLKIGGKKPIVVKIQQKVFAASVALNYFTTKTWEFKNDKVFWLRDQILPSDKKDFDLDNVENLDIVDYFRKAYLGARMYLLKEPLDTLPEAKKHYQRMYWLDIIVRNGSWLLLFWFIYKSAFLQYTLHNIYKLYEAAVNLNVDIYVA